VPNSSSERPSQSLNNQNVDITVEIRPDTRKLSFGIAPLESALVPDLEIVYKTAKPRGSKDELISSAKISTVFAEAHQLRKAMQADDCEDASQPSSPAAASASQSCS